MSDIKPKITTWRVVAPEGMNIITNLGMNDEELRRFAKTLITDNNETWDEKIKRDHIQEVINYLKKLGYTVKKNKNK